MTRTAAIAPFVSRSNGLYDEYELKGWNCVDMFFHSSIQKDVTLMLQQDVLVAITRKC